MKKQFLNSRMRARNLSSGPRTVLGRTPHKYVDWSKAKRAKLPNLRPSLRTISVRLPVAMIEDLKILANKRDVPYQSLLKMFLAERLEAERI